MQQHPLRHDLLGPLPNSQVSLKTWEHFGAGMGLSNNPDSLGRVTGPMYADTHFDLSLSCPFFNRMPILLPGHLVSIPRLQPTKTIRLKCESLPYTAFT